MHSFKKSTLQQTEFMTARKLTSLIVLAFLAICSLLLSIFKGSTPFTISQISQALFFHTDATSYDIVFNLRLPRTLCAFVTGGLLALAGTLMQVLLKNPLADPYILGTSGGSALATLLLMMLGVTGIGLTLGAWVGSLAVIALIFSFSLRQYAMQTETLILIGVALSSCFSAMISLIFFISPDHLLRSMLFWLLGDLSDAHFPTLATVILIIGVIYSSCLATELNILVRGENEARSLGIHVSRLKIQLFLLSSLLTAAAVTMAGCIGFIGLIVPHLFRLLFGYEHRFMIIGCTLLGGAFLTFADTLSRIIIAPQEIPVGIVMVLLGIPLFIFLLRKPQHATII